MRLIGIIFMVIGLSFMGVAAWWYVSTQQFIGRAVHVEGVVVDFKRERSNSSSKQSGSNWTYYPLVEFTHDGIKQQFKNPLGRSSPGYAVGARVNVLYDPEKPGAAKINSFGTLWAGPIMLGVLGFVFTLFSALPNSFRLRRKRQAEWYKANAEPLMATIRSIRQNEMVAINRKHPWVIEADWLDPVTGQTVQFTSPHLWEDPSPKISSRQIRVYALQSNRKKYWMDVTGLEQT